MNHMRANLAGLLLLFGAAAAAGQPAGGYRKTIAEWRAHQEAQLKADDGWLTVVGLHWLKEGESRVGSNASFEVPLPKSAPDRVGTITIRAGMVRFKPAEGVAVSLNGKPTTVEAELKPDTTPKYDVLAIGRVKFFVIKREDRFGVRVKDNDSTARKEFSGLRWYPVDASWRVQGRFIPWYKPHPLTFETTVGMKERDESPGYVSFQRNGKRFTMEPVVDGKQLWFVMRDGTSGKTTYAASRFLYADPPKDGIHKSGSVELDFNRAENPPCVFTDFATCPLPPAQNRLPLAVTAGEQTYRGHH
jgi:uncharacterized protein